MSKFQIDYRLVIKAGLITILIVIFALQAKEQFVKFIEKRTTLALTSDVFDKLHLPSLLLCPEPNIKVDAPFSSIFGVSGYGDTYPNLTNNNDLMRIWKEAVFREPLDFDLVFNTWAFNYTMEELFTNFM